MAEFGVNYAWVCNSKMFYVQRFAAVEVWKEIRTIKKEFRHPKTIAVIILKFKHYGFTID